MHELSLIENILDQLEEMKVTYHLATITRVRVLVGDISGADLRFLRSAFEMQREHSKWPHLIMEFDSVPWTVRCLSCQRESTVQGDLPQCHHCGSEKTETLQGSELTIQQVEGEQNV